MEKIKKIVAHNWYEEFFQGLNCELWGKAVTPEWNKKEVDFIVSELKIKPGQTILDIPCGFGRHSVELAKRGFHVTGVDISPTFIKGLTKQIKKGKLSVRVIEANVLTLKLTQKFHGIICMGNCFGHFDFDKMKLFIEKVSSCLHKGAKFIINSGMIAESILPNFTKHRMFTINDIKMSILNVYNVDDSSVTSHIVYTKNSMKEEHSFKHYVFTMEEVSRLLKMYGLDIIHNYNSTSKEEYSFGDEQIYMVAEKQ